VNAVDAFFGRLERAGADARSLPRVAAIGPATAERLRTHGVLADCQPPTYTGAALVDALAATGSLRGLRVLLPRAAEAPPTVPDGLEKLGATVTVVPAYSTAIATDADPDLVRRFEAGSVDAVTFTSSSTVRGFLEAMGATRLASLPASIRLVSIGPVTSATAREAGLSVAAEAADHTIPGLVQTVLHLLEPNLQS
jgi:uroporphyrinogen III methyltransferase/synthase